MNCARLDRAWLGCTSAWVSGREGCRRRRGRDGGRGGRGSQGILRRSCARRKYRNATRPQRSYLIVRQRCRLHCQAGHARRRSPGHGRNIACYHGTRDRLERSGTGRNTLFSLREALREALCKSLSRGASGRDSGNREFAGSTSSSSGRRVRGIVRTFGVLRISLFTRAAHTGAGFNQEGLSGAGNRPGAVGGRLSMPAVVGRWLVLRPGRRPAGSIRTGRQHAAHHGIKTGGRAGMGGRSSSGGRQTRRGGGGGRQLHHEPPVGTMRRIAVKLDCCSHASRTWIVCPGTGASIALPLPR